MAHRIHPLHYLLFEHLHKWFTDSKNLTDVHVVVVLMQALSLLTRESMYTIELHSLPLPLAQYYILLRHTGFTVTSISNTNCKNVVLLPSSGYVPLHWVRVLVENN